MVSENVVCMNAVDNEEGYASLLPFEMMMNKISDHSLNHNKNSDNSRSEKPIQISVYTLKREEIENPINSLNTVNNYINQLFHQGVRNKRLLISGYDSDPRPLLEIPEVQLFFKVLFLEDSPVLAVFHYASSLLIAQCLATALKKDVFSVEFIDEFLTRQLHSLNKLVDDDAEHEKIIHLMCNKVRRFPSVMMNANEGSQASAYLLG